MVIRVYRDTPRGSLNRINGGEDFLRARATYDHVDGLVAPQLDCSFGQFDRRTGLLLGGKQIGCRTGYSHETPDPAATKSRDPVA